MTETKGVMLILRGIRNLLHEEPAKEFATFMGYTPEVLDASGETGLFAPQVNAAIKRIQAGNGDVTAIYGFSGGGYNARHIFERLNDDHKHQIKKVVVLGAPGIDAGDFPPYTDVTIYDSGAYAHMDIPDAFLAIERGDPPPQLA